MKFIRNILIVLLLAMGAWWLLGKMDILPSLGNVFKSKEVVIDDTPVIIEQIKPLAELITITAYTEVTADTSKKATTGERLRDVFNPFKFDVETDKKLVVIGKVIIHAGVDLSTLQPDQVFVSDDSVHINLPKAKILDVIINPSATEVFLETGKWDAASINNLKQRMKQNAIAEVQRRGILYQAEQRAVEVLTDFFKAAGYQQVTIGAGRLG